MKKCNLLLLIITLLSAVIFSGCEVGMGASVDLEAPSISVKQMVTGAQTVNTSFETSIYCTKNVTFYGTAEDN